MKATTLGLIAVLATASWLSACVVPPPHPPRGPVIVAPGAPVIVAPRPPRPSPRHVWVDGYWKRGPAGRVWVPGHWRR